MSGAHTQRLLAHAEEMLQQGHVDQTIDVLTRILGEDPDEADAHALLALALIRRKRLHAAQLEADAAAALDPDSLTVHLAMAAILTVRRQFPQAEKELLIAAEMAPASGGVHAQLARLYRAWGRDRDAMANAIQACELQPGSASHWALRAGLEYASGNRELAREHAAAALETDPEHVEALIVLGHCDLAAGRTDAARSHAAWALQNDPTDEGALTLLCAIKARRSPALGLWWRFQNFLLAGSQQRTILLLVGMYLIYRVLLIAFEHNGYEGWLTWLSLAWLGFCAYTWVAPGIFWKSVNRELRTVSLSRDY